MKIKKIKHPVFACNNITHGFFTRSGGLSKKPYKSLNCSFNNGDDHLNVKGNINLVSKDLKLNKIILLNQIHSSKIITIESYDSIYDFRNADGMVTNLSGVGLSILGADCAPILFYDRFSKTIGACHAGWRGATDNIVEVTICKMEALGAKRNHITALIGPTIQKDSYEIGEDVANIIRKCSFFDTNKNILSKKTSDKYLFDLPLLLKQSLKHALINQIVDVKLDTYKNREDFFSHRRQSLEYPKNKNITGRQISVIGILT